MAGSDMRWLSIASVFPAGLDTETAPQELKDGFTPDGYGFDIEYPGRLVAASSQIDNGDPYTARSFAIGDPGDEWTWFFRRLWRINTQNLEYNAPEYQDKIFYQDLDGISFDEIDGQVIYDFFPIGPNMFVSCGSGGYIIANASSFEGDFQHGSVEEQMYITNAVNAAPLDNVAFVSNADGVFQWSGGDVVEVTELVRSDIAFFTDRPLRINEPKRRLIGTFAGDTEIVNFVYDKRMGKLFVYQNDNTAFRYTTRTLTDSNQRPFPVRQVAFEFDNTTEKRGEIVFDVKLDTGDFGNEHTAVIDDFEEHYNRVTVDLETSPQSHEFALRITKLSPHIHIRKIWVETNMTTDEDSPSQ